MNWALNCSRYARMGRSDAVHIRGALDTTPDSDIYTRAAAYWMQSQGPNCLEIVKRDMRGSRGCSWTSARPSG